jgi:hypothetical protein
VALTVFDSTAEFVDEYRKFALLHSKFPDELLSVFLHDVDVIVKGSTIATNVDWIHPEYLE